MDPQRERAHGGSSSRQGRTMSREYKCECIPSFSSCTHAGGGGL